VCAITDGYPLAPGLLSSDLCVQAGVGLCRAACVWVLGVVVHASCWMSCVTGRVTSCGCHLWEVVTRLLATGM
jgi:hypothetical protein